MPEDKLAQPNKPVCIRLSFVSGELEVRAALGQLMRALAPIRLADVDENTVELVLGEVLNNVVEHAYGPDASGRITMDCVLEEGSLQFCVRDCGRALPGKHLPVGRAPDLDRPCHELPEGGFGWFLVHSLAVELNYRRDAERNVLSFGIALSQ